MSKAPTITYTPPPTIREFIKDFLPGQLFSDWIVGPVGSGKTTGLFFKLVYMAQQQAKGPDGIRRSRAVVVRNTNQQLKDTTLSSWAYWFKDGQAGTWHATRSMFVLRFGDVECEVLFRPLDTPEDIARVLSLEVTFAIIDEFVEIPKAIIEALSARCGRYPSSVMGGCTNWGMWGSSNPSTEDNWWFDYLHDETIHVQPAEMPIDKDAMVSAMFTGGVRNGRNSRYLLQPSGFSDHPENTENLPGGKEYYTNLAKGKTEAWIKQFIEAQWGFSVAGKPVVASFRMDIHLSKQPLVWNPGLLLVAGFDPGLGGSAMLFGQEDYDGRLLVFGELVQTGYGAKRFMSEKMRPFMNRRFPGLIKENFVVAPDPAAANRTGTDEGTVVAEMRKHFNISLEKNNRLPLRLDAIDYFMTRLVEGKSAVIIDEKACPMLVRALKGGWRYPLDAKEKLKGDAPEKNEYSHPGDAFGYLCRYFHRQAARNERYNIAGAAPFVPPKKFGSVYHMR